MELKDMDLKELKAMAYDILTSQQSLQQDLIAVNQEIINRQIKTPVVVKEEIKTEEVK